MEQIVQSHSSVYGRRGVEAGEKKEVAATVLKIMLGLTACGFVRENVARSRRMECCRRASGGSRGSRRRFR